MFNLILPFIINALIPLSVKVVKAYTSNTETKFDDKILDLSKDAVGYLAVNTNNTVTKVLAESLCDSNMIVCQKPK